MDRQIHPLALLLMAIIFLVATFLKLTMLKLMLLYFVLLPYLFQKQSDIKLHLKKFTYILFAVLMLVILKVAYSHDTVHYIFEYAIRLFFLFSVSMFSFSIIDFDKIFIYLMASEKLKTIWGYSLLLAMNSLQLLKREQERIAFNAKLRGLKWHQQYLVFFPILVFAIRHSERGAMALVTRGLSPKKLFYRVSFPSKQDRIILISYLLLTLTFFLAA
jgi:hypothetical protein